MNENMNILLLSNNHCKYKKLCDMTHRCIPAHCLLTFGALSRKFKVLTVLTSPLLADMDLREASDCFLLTASGF